MPGRLVRPGGNLLGLRPWYRFVRSLAYGLGRLVWGVRVEGRENVPRTGPLLVTCNHVSNLDPPVVASVIPREIGFVAKKELFAVPVLGSLIRSLNAMPLDRSRLSVEALDRFGAFLSEGNALLMFPEGTRSRTGRLGRAKIGAGVLLARFPTTVLPVYVQGTNTLFRSMLRRGRMRVVFGRPYTLPKGEGSGAPEREEYRRIADLVLDRIRQLKEGADASEREAGPPAAETRRASGRAGSSAGRDRITREGMVPEV